MNQAPFNFMIFVASIFQLAIYVLGIVALVLFVKALKIYIGKNK